MSTPNLMTYRDAIDHLVAYTDGLPNESEQKRARGAIQDAYREVGLDRRWRGMLRHDRITLDAPYETGTVTFDAGTRQVTLDGGTWPSWARYGTLKITGYNALYKAAERTSDSVITLSPVFAPEDSIATGTTYTLFRSSYYLPGDFLGIVEIHDELAQWSGGYVEPNEWLRAERAYNRSGRPFAWTLMADPDLFGSMCLQLDRYPTSATTLDYIYHRQPRRLVLDGYTRHGSDVSANGTLTSWTGTQVSMTAYLGLGSLVNAVLRISNNNSSPTGLDGTNPWVIQRIIVDAALSGAVSLLTVDRTIEQTTDYEWGGAHGNGYAISDPIDLPEYLWTAFKRGMEFHWAIRTGDERKIALCRQLYDQSRLEARRYDNMVPVPASANWQGWRHPSWAYLTGTITPS